MRYEVFKSVGDVTTTKDYEGTPEEIVKLITLLRSVSFTQVEQEDE